MSDRQAGLTQEMLSHLKMTMPHANAAPQCEDVKSHIYNNNSYIVKGREGKK